MPWHSVGATLGYAVALQGKQRVVACIGDGSFQVTAQARPARNALAPKPQSDDGQLQGTRASCRTISACTKQVAYNWNPSCESSIRAGTA